MIETFVVGSVLAIVGVVYLLNFLHVATWICVLVAVALSLLFAAVIMRVGRRSAR